MRRLRNGLFLALIFQLALAGVLWSSQRQDATPEPLFGFEGTVDRLQIEGADGEVATLTRVDGSWQLPELHDLPVDASRVSKLLADLKTLKRGWPVSQRSQSQERFEVTQETFQRRVVIFHGQQELTRFFLGSTPSFGKTHLRLADETTVYSVPLSSYDVYQNDLQWLDKRLLAVKNPTRLEGGDFVLVKTGTEWKSEPEERGALDQQKCQELVRQLTGLTVIEPVEDSFDPDATLKAGEFTFELARENGQTYLRRSDRELWFRINQHTYEQLAEKDLKDLLQD